jgi:hypothetical protein
VRDNGTLVELHKQQGVAGWRDNLDGYRSLLEAAGHKAQLNR